MKKNMKPGPLFVHTPLSLEARLQELTQQFHAMDAGPERDRLSVEIDDTQVLVKHLFKHALEHQLVVNVTVKQQIKI